jgi:hypothetical protein
VLIGRTEYYDTGGNNVTVQSNRVFGAVRYSPSNYSTVFAESVSRNNRFIYGFDIYNGVAWRDSANGLFPISGRYAEAGGDSDYKMQTYFKLKAKALLESGIDHVDVIGTWDEEYKLYYLTFKDFVLETNNETIVFHEPSNRWITFAEFEQTPLGGFNVLLELTYEIVKGFEAGIGFNFNKDTRFAEFNIASPSSNFNPSLDEASLIIDAYEPSVTVDCAPDGDVATLVIAGYEPTTTITAAPDPQLLDVWYIPDTEVGSALPVQCGYSNVGDAGTATVDWRIKDSGGSVISSGSQSVLFSGIVVYGGVSLYGIVCPSYSINPYNIEVKLSTQAWGAGVTISFYAILP